VSRHIFAYAIILAVAGTYLIHDSLYSFGTVLMECKSYIIARSNVFTLENLIEIIKFSSVP
jgi:hypothetical protein